MKQSRIQYIKEKWTVIDYAHDVLGWPVRYDGDRTISIAPGSENPTSLIVHENTWHDFKTGEGGDVIDLCALVKYGGDKGQAIRELSEGYYNPDEKLSRFDWTSYTQNLCNQIQYYHEHLRPQDIEYLHSRKINDAAIERLKLGYDVVEDRLIIPYFKNGYVAYYAGRDRSGKKEASKYKKATLDGFNENIPWGLHTMTKEHREKFMSKSLEASDSFNIDLESILVIAEGAFDVMSFEQEGFQCLSPIGGFFNKKVNKMVVDYAKHFKQVFICFDSDSAGNKFTIAMCKLMFENRIDFICGVLPPNVKDVSDYYTAGGNLYQLVQFAEKGIEVLASKITDKQEFREFVRQAARYCDEADLAILFSKVTQFDSEWLAALKKIVTKCPAESAVISSVIENNKLRYVEKVGFYEYHRGAWRSRCDNEIMKILGDELGKFATGTKLKSLLAHLKSRISTKIIFDRAHIFNFQNGILELDTGNLVAHSESYDSSIQMAYSYDPNAEAPRWNKFIAEVMDDNPEKMLLVQEIAGYILCADLRMQKCFFFMGEGANGKSVLINVLREVFGSENCSAVSISHLGQSFESIRLLNSLVNFTTETDTNIKEAEAQFKAVVSGDPISACYKGKDFIEFSPRCVMISACNNFMNSRDVSNGFLRRIGFLKFTRTFAGEDDNKNLTQELCEELPGIFNWCYEGYKRLMKQGEFTKTQEQDEIMKEYTEIIDPVTAFFQDEYGNLEEDVIVYSTELYAQYKKWCESNGHLPASRQKFMRSFKIVLKRERPASLFSHSGNERTFNIRLTVPF